MTTPATSAADKVALVTGGARGIGAAIAGGLRAIGAKVAVLDLDGAALATCPEGVLRVQADIARRRGLRDGGSRVRASYGGLDVLINNAGIGMSMIREEHFAQPVRLSEITPDHWRRMFEVNCMGAFLMTRAATAAHGRPGLGPHRERDHRLLHHVERRFCAYGPPERRSRRRPRSWAKEFEGTGVTVSVLIPGGPTDTRMVPTSAPFARSEMIPPAAMAPPARWLASPASDGSGRPALRRRAVGSGAAPRASSGRERAIARELTSQGRVWPGL